MNDAISLVSSLEFPMVYCNPKHHHLFLKHGWNFHLRMELSLKSRNEIGVLNSDMNIQPIKTLDIFKKSSWYKERSVLYGSDENFLIYGTGYALCIGSEVVSEAYAGIGNGYAEIGVITHPSYRGKGYAAIITSHLIKQCVDAQLIPKWSCNVDNEASFNTSLRLGFEIDGYYTLLVPNCGNVLCQNLVDWLKIIPYKRS